MAIALIPKQMQNGKKNSKKLYLQAADSLCHGKRKNTTGKPLILITPVHEAEKFMKDCFLAVGTPPENADIVAKSLVTADFRGYYSHGMNRLKNYILDIKNCKANPAAQAEIVKETAAVALVDGKNGLGAVIGTRCMQMAIDKAKQVGIGFVAARGCNHYGLASTYPLQAMQEGLIGFSVSNTSPLMCPIRAKKAALGTNPIALGANGCEGDSFVLDIATTAVSLGKVLCQIKCAPLIEYHRMKGEKIPPGWALNGAGKPETDATVAARAGNLMPLGGSEEHSGYKGYGLALLVEVLTGLLSGAAYGPKVRKWDKANEAKAANLGTTYMAIDPDFFEPGFAGRLQDLMCHLRQMEPADADKPVLVHGDLERQHMKKVAEEGGLRYVENQHKTMQKLAKELKVQLPCSLPLKEC